MSASFPGRLKALIKETGLRREEFADRVNTSRSQLFNYLKGENVPGFHFFELVKENFPWVSLDELIAGVDHGGRGNGNVSANGSGAIAAGGSIKAKGSINVGSGSVYAGGGGGSADAEYAEVAELLKYANKPILADLKAKLLKIKAATEI